MLFALEYMLTEFGTLPARYREAQEQVGTQVAPERLEQSQQVEATRATADVKIRIEQVRDRVQNVA
jgi:hypothetical protein